MTSARPRGGEAEGRYTRWRRPAAGLERVVRCGWRRAGRWAGTAGTVASHGPAGNEKAWREGGGRRWRRFTIPTGRRAPVPFLSLRGSGLRSLPRLSALPLRRSSAAAPSRRPFSPSRCDSAAAGPGCAALAMLAEGGSRGQWGQARGWLLSVVFRSSDACPSASPWWICFLGAVGIRVKGECPPGEGGFLAAVTRSYVESPFLLVWMGWGQRVAVVELSFWSVVFLWCLHCENHNIQSSLWCYISAVFSRVFAGWRAEVLFTVWVVAILISLHAHYLFLEHFQLAVPLLSWKESHIVCIWDADIPWMYIIA